ncbi:ScbR family autoregulator-binding transcription factor [Streptacidiphilus sp. EB103A]|uniref:ScbR family autoregulator-binding transcription factor n=1 Tax=Streptacidiphilus sp. EB103A TaxID=3156275 RepID=UPI0035185D22
MQERAQSTRELILRSAAELFDAKGYAVTSVNAIARQAQCTSGALYFHFASKDELAAAVVEAHFAAWQPMVHWAQELPVPALQRLLTLSYAVVRAFRDDVIVRAGGRLWSERRSIDAGLPKPFVGWITVVTDLLGQAETEGSLRTGLDLAEAAETVVCALFGVHSVSDVMDRRKLVEQRLDALWLLLLPGLTQYQFSELPGLIDSCRTRPGPTGTTQDRRPSRL